MSSDSAYTFFFLPLWKYFKVLKNIFNWYITIVHIYGFNITFDICKHCEVIKSGHSVYPFLSIYHLFLVRTSKIFSSVILKYTIEYYWLLSPTMTIFLLINLSPLPPHSSQKKSINSQDCLFPSNSSSKLDD
jgi:hypothetical protein